MNAMSTASGMVLLQEHGNRMMAAYAKEVQREFSELTLLLAFGREVGAQRARLLRRRGAIVRKTKRLTATGKPRYLWLPS